MEKIKKVLFLSFCLLFSLNKSFSQRKENSIKFGLIQPAWSTLEVSYERFFSDSEFSLQLNASVTQRKVTIWESLTPQLKGYGAELQARYYWGMLQNHIIPSGWYSGVFAKYTEMQVTLDIPDGRINFIDGKSKFVGLIGGLQYGFMNKVFLDISLGGSYHFADYSGKFSEKGRVIPSITSSGFLPKLDVKLGFAF